MKVLFSFFFFFSISFGENVKRFKPKENICIWFFDNMDGFKSLKERGSKENIVNQITQDFTFDNPNYGYHSERMTHEQKRPRGQINFLKEELNLNQNDTEFIIGGGIHQLAKDIKNIQSNNGLKEEEQINLGMVFLMSDGEVTFKSLDSIKNFDDIPKDALFYYENGVLEFSYWAFAMSRGIMPINLNASVFGHDLGHIEEFTRFPEICKKTRLFYKKMIDGVNDEPSYLIRRLKAKKKKGYSFLTTESFIELIKDKRVDNKDIFEAVEGYKQFAELINENFNGQVLYVYKGVLSEDDLKILRSEDKTNAMLKLKELLDKDEVFHILGGSSRDGANSREYSHLGEALTKFQDGQNQENNFNKILKIINYSVKKEISVGSFIDSLTIYNPSIHGLAFRYLAELHKL